MAQIINTNITSLNAQRNTAMSQSSLAISMQRLSSGMRVNSAKDDAAGLAIAERMNAQVRGMNVAIRNANDGISLAQTAEGARWPRWAMRCSACVSSRCRPATPPTPMRTRTRWTRSSASCQEIQRVIGGTTFNGIAILGGGRHPDLPGRRQRRPTDDIDVTTTDMTADADITTLAGTDNTGAGRAVIDNTAVGATIDTGDRQHRHRHRQGQQPARHARRLAEPLRGRDLQPAGLGREPGRARSRIMDADFAPKPPTSAAPRSSSRLAPWWRRPTSCRSRC